MPTYMYMYTDTCMHVYSYVGVSKVANAHSIAFYGYDSKYMSCICTHTNYVPYL